MLSEPFIALRREFLLAAKRFKEAKATRKEKHFSGA
jgi:hypothetical protein